MASSKEMRLRIRSVNNISQVTRALETVAASRVRKMIQALNATQPYAEKAWKVLLHLARQPGHNSLSPMLNEKQEVKNILVLMVSGDRGLAGAYNMNIVRYTLQHFASSTVPVSYITVGRKGRDLLIRRRSKIIAEFSGLPAPPTFQDVSAIGRLIIDDFLQDRHDQVFLAYTEFESLSKQFPAIRKLLPLEIEESKEDRVKKFNVTHKTNSVFTYEPDDNKLLETIITRFTSLQVYQSILESLASEFAARMVAMHNATENAHELVEMLTLEYNKARQSNITKELLDISGGAEALAQVVAQEVNA